MVSSLDNHHIIPFWWRHCPSNFLHSPPLCGQMNDASSSRLLIVLVQSLQFLLVGHIRNEVAGSKLAYRTTYSREWHQGNITMKFSRKHHAHVPWQPRSQSQTEEWRLRGGRVINIVAGKYFICGRNFDRISSITLEQPFNKSEKK